jgi:hypothetical protein
VPSDPVSANAFIAVAAEPATMNLRLLKGMIERTMTSGSSSMVGECRAGTLRAGCRPVNNVARTAQRTVAYQRFSVSEPDR